MNGKIGEEAKTLVWKSETKTKTDLTTEKKKTQKNKEASVTLGSGKKW